MQWLVKQRKKDRHFCTWNCSIGITSIWQGAAMKRLTLPEIRWHNWRQVQRPFQETRGISAASGTLAWIKLLLTALRNGEIYGGCWIDSLLADSSMTPFSPATSFSTRDLCAWWYFGVIWEATGIWSKIWAVFTPAKCGEWRLFSSSLLPSHIHTEKEDCLCFTWMSFILLSAL